MTFNDFYRGKRVLITGHTGFKGTWLCRILHKLGAEVFGYALRPPTEPNIYEIVNADQWVSSKIDDVRNYSNLFQYYQTVRPDIVFHLAAQPIVRESYMIPRETYEINVMGTTNILECVRLLGAKSFVNVTTDKVYHNTETNRRYVESDELNGYDPYSNSKSCSELVTQTYARSFKMCPISTARAGNVIGGGDFAKDRIIPDCVRATISGKQIELRNPNSIRPYQHVLEPLYSYLTIAWMQTVNPNLAGSYNIGPSAEDCITTSDLATLFCQYWGKNASWVSKTDSSAPHEANFLKLDSTLISKKMGVNPLWNSNKSIEKVVIWYKKWSNDEDVLECMDDQIQEYFRYKKTEEPK